MRLVEYPVKDFESQIRNSKTAFPVSNGGFWHNGIHFSGIDSIQAIYDGEIVAVRLSETYEDSFIYKDNKILLVMMAMLKGPGGILYYLDSTKSDFERYFDIEENCYKMKDDLTDEEKEDAMRAVGDLFSNNFLLLRHEAKNQYGTPIVFYSLAQHLKPLGRLTNAQKMSLFWYETSVTIQNPTYSAVPISSCKKKVGDTESPAGITNIPCETIVTVIENGEKTSKIQWILNDTTYTASIQTKYIRFDCRWEPVGHTEIRRPATDEEKEAQKDQADNEKKYLENGYSPQRGILIYNTDIKADRVTQVVLDANTAFTITDIDDALDGYGSEKGTIKVMYKATANATHEKTGYIYMEEPLDADGKKALEKFKESITGNAESKERIGGIELKICLKDGVQKNKIHQPRECAIRKGTVIGFAGHTITKEIDGEKVLDNEDATAIHYEIFCPDIDFLTKNKSEKQGCEYQVHEEATAQKGMLHAVKKTKPLTIEGTTVENMTNTYLRCVGQGALVKGEVFYKMKTIATITTTVGNEFVKRDEAFEQWDVAYSTWKGRKNSSVSLYDRSGTVLAEKSFPLYKDLYYHFKEQVDDVAVKELNLRRATYRYEKNAVQHEFWINQETFAKLRKVRDNDYLLVTTTISADEILEEPSETKWSEEEERIEPGDYTHERGSVIEYTKCGGTTVKNEWQKMTRATGGAPVWVLVKDIKEVRDGKPVERKRYNDWNRYFTEIDVLKAGKYRLSSLTADQFKKVGLSESEGKTLEMMAIHSMSQSVTGCPMPFGSIVQSYSPARERWALCYYKAVTEWKKDDEYTDALCPSDRVMRKRTEKLRDGLCFWDDAKNAGSPHFPESDENWYFHPQQFIDHLNKVITPAEFNPYEGLDPLTISTGGIILKSRTQEFRSNPGFAPYNTDLSVSNGYEYKNLKYAYITCLFDIPRKFDNGNSDIHTGIDFGSWQKSVPIKSFIHGEVLECTWNGSKEKNSSGFGNMMLIKGDNGYLYLLAHLESFLITEGRIKPDDDIAMSGTTGNSSGYHLHLEIVKPFGNLSIETMYKIGADNQFTGWHSPEQRLNRFNPFDHDDKFHSYSGGKI